MIIFLPATILTGCRGYSRAPTTRWQGRAFNSANTILAQGAALAQMAMCDRFEAGDVTDLIKTGDVVTVDPQRGEVIIAKG